MSWFSQELLVKQNKFKQIDNKLKLASFLLEEIKEVQDEEISQTFEAISFSPPSFGKKKSRSKKKSRDRDDADNMCDAFNTKKRFLQEELLKQQTELLTLAKEIAAHVEDMVKESSILLDEDLSFEVQTDVAKSSAQEQAKSDK